LKHNFCHQKKNASISSVPLSYQILILTDDISYQIIPLQAVSRLNLYFLTPCLLFTKMASTITWDQFKAFYPIPIFYCFFSLTSWTIAKLGSRLLGFSRDEEKFVIASVVFSNTNSLPMALVQSLAMSGAGERLLRDSEGRDEGRFVAARGMSYILFYAIFGNLVRWSYGFSLLVPKDDPRVTERDQEGNVKLEPTKGDDEVWIDMDNNPQTHQNPNPSPSPAPSLSSTKLSMTTTLFQKMTRVFDKLRQVLTPPLLTALVALVVGLVPVLHQFFMSPESKFYAFVIHPLEECGSGAIPLILLCLGAQVVHLASSSPPSAGSPSLSTDVDSHEQHEQDSISSVPRRNVDKSLEESNEENVDRQLQGQAQDRPSGLTSRLPLSHASSSITLYQSEVLAISTAATPHWQPNPVSPLCPFTLSSPTVHPGPAARDSETDDSHDKTSPLGSSDINKSTNSRLGHLFSRISPVGYAILARNIITPLVCLPAILFHPTSLSPTLTQDPVFKMVLVLVVAAPTAINLTQLCQIKGFFEREMASLLFWSYCVLGVPFVLGWALVGLWASGR
jgi:predicted permease